MGRRRGGGARAAPRLRVGPAWVEFVVETDDPLYLTQLAKMGWRSETPTTLVRRVAVSGDVYPDRLRVAGDEDVLGTVVVEGATVEVSVQRLDLETGHIDQP